MFNSRDDVRKALFGDDQGVAKLLDGSDYEQGELEDMKATLDNLRMCTGRLVRLLMIKGVITTDQAVDVMFKYGRDASETPDPSDPG